MAGSVLVLAVEPRQDIAGELQRAGYDAHALAPAPGDGAEASRLCLSVAITQTSSPVTVVGVGQAAAHLPAVALSLRTAHRRVAEYVLIDADVPTVTESWPDAPVTIVIDDPDDAAANQARLRGWRTLRRGQWDQWEPAGD